MTGSLKVVGLGPGDENMITPEVSQALAHATDIVGYEAYVDRIASRPDLKRHISDNRFECARALHALNMAAEGKHVVIVSSGDPGVFAMASALFEVVETEPAKWAMLDIQILPGISAMFAASAYCGAPLGHDFCAINLSDNLKPWSLIEKRLRLALEADFVITLYNPRSRARPEGFEKTLQILHETCSKQRIMVFARAVSTPEQNIKCVPLCKSTAQMADMRTLVLIGSSATRMIKRKQNSPFIYTPRSV